MTPTVRRGYEIADHFRRRGVKVVMGGHARLEPARGGAGALRQRGHRGGGRLWPKLLADFERQAIAAHLPA